MAVLKPDICVIGAGSGGLTTAAAAAAFGVPVVLVEKHLMGGDCLNTGCVPSKALLAAAKQAEAMRQAERFGLPAVDPRIDFAKVMAHVRGVQAAIEPNDSEARFTGLGVKVIRGAARFTGPDGVVVGEHTIRARRFVIATGSRAAIPPVSGLAEVPFLTNETVWGLTTLPERLVVLGGGPIGLELAQAFRRLGSAVTVLDIGQPLPKDDPEAGRLVLSCLAKEGVVLRTGVEVKGVRRDTAGIAVHILDQERPDTIVASHLLVATGRRPNVEELGLETAGVQHSPKGILVDRGLRTTNRRVYAIGDVAGGPMFTHVAGWQGALVARTILFRLPIRFDPDIVPWVTYTEPELAQAGLTEALARARHGAAVRVLRWPFHDNDRAQTERATEGHIKVVTDRRGTILGATIVGAHAGEIANMWSLAVAQKLNIRAFTGFISPYPTLAEVGRRAAVTFFLPTLTSPLVKSVIWLLRRLG